MTPALAHVSDYLVHAELRELDVWHRQDYRLAWLILVVAAEGKANRYSKAFRMLFQKNAHEVRFWWRDRKKLLWLAEATLSKLPLVPVDR